MGGVRCRGKRRPERGPHGRWRRWTRPRQGPCLPADGPGGRLSGRSRWLRRRGAPPAATPAGSSPPGRTGSASTRPRAGRCAASVGRPGTRPAPARRPRSCATTSGCATRHSPRARGGGCCAPTTLATRTPRQALSRCHPLITRDGRHEAGEHYAPDEPYTREDLTDLCSPHQERGYGLGDLAAVRKKVAQCAAEYGLTGRRLRELSAAVTEVATNSVRHGGGQGSLRAWSSGTAFLCEFSGGGYIADPLAGRIRPTHSRPGGRGLWLVHQLCDLVEIRSAPQTGATVRLHMDRAADIGRSRRAPPTAVRPARVRSGPLRGPGGRMEAGHTVRSRRVPGSSHGRSRTRPPDG